MSQMSFERSADNIASSEARLSRCVSGTLDGLWDWDISGDVFWGSPQFWKLVGLPDHDETGTLDEWNSWMHPDDMEPLWSSIQEHLVGKGETYNCQARLRLPDGQFRWFHCRGLAVRDETGKAQRLAGSIRDIQSHKELEFALREQVAERDRFLAMLSHELRNPLAAVKNAARLCLDAHDDEESRELALKVIQRQVRQVARLLDDLLEVSRISLGTFEMRKEWYDLRESFDAALETVAAQVAEKGHVLKTELADAPVPVFGDRARLIQAQVNLLVNAIRYTPRGGSITYRLREEGGQAVIEVSDSGTGLDPSLLPRLFQPFQRGSGHQAEHEAGMGLGLSLVKTIAEAHGGTVEANSPGPGRGSTFRIQLPIEDVPQGQTLSPVSDEGNRISAIPASVVPIAASPGREASVPQRCNVLLVDDLAAGRNMLARWLQRRGLAVVECGSGEEALELLDRHQEFDAAVIDIGLPGLSGYALATLLKNSPKTRSLFLIALTGYGREDDQIAASKAGFDRHLTKPADLDQLLELLLQNATRKVPDTH